MVDADGATKFQDIEKLEKEIKKIETNGLSVAIGSRAHLKDDAVAKRSFFRNILMYGFHFLISIFGIRNIKDTQCGFKLFSRKASEIIWPNVHIERWAFDVEVIFLAQYFKIPIAEVGVNWQEIDGSKLSPFAASVQMGRDIIRIRMNYLLGLWKINNKKKN